MIKPEDYKKMSIHESHFSDGFEVGVKIMVAGVDPSEAACKAIRSHTDGSMEGILRDHELHNDKSQALGAKETAELIACFDGPIYVEKIPNGYCSQYCCVNKPWLVVTTRHGRIKIGWRKRVINIDWSDSAIEAGAAVLFDEKDTSSGEKWIHAYGYGKAKEYIAKLMLAGDNQVKAIPGPCAR